MGFVSTTNLDDVFTYHAPTEEDQRKYARLTEAAKAFVQAVLEEVPSCADASSAIRHIRLARMEANAAVALKGVI